MTSLCFLGGILIYLPRTGNNDKFEYLVAAKRHKAGLKTGGCTMDILGLLGADYGIGC